jgi:amino acid adenylation domain-containing protein
MADPACFDFPKEACAQSLAARFEEIARKVPGRPALRHGTRSLTYDELNRRSNRLAQALLEQLTGQDATILLLLRDPIHHVIAQLGVVKTGRACVPVDASFPAARQRQIAADAGARLVVAELETLPSALALGYERSSVVIVDELRCGLSENNPELPVLPDCLAYVLYTSGSTGSPKGIMQSQQNLLHVAMLYHRDLGIGPSDRITSPTSPAYTGTIWALLAALMNGAAFVFTALDSAGAFIETLEKEEITVAQLIVSLLRQVAQSFEERIHLPRLRLIYTGGETLRGQDIARCARVLPAGCRVLYDYGSTEAGIITHQLVNLSAPAPESAAALYPVGYPVADIEVLLLDDQGEVVAAGEDGEVAVRSNYLSPGYWRDPALTRKCFLTDASRGTTAVFRTGDLGRIAADGSLFHLGRKDFQVKVRGYRINLIEIENALGSLDGVGEAACVARASESSTRIVAYIEKKPATTISIKDLRAQLSATLPGYMLPSIFIFLERLPISANGKLDRSALPDPPESRPELDTAYVPPKSRLEHRLAQMWSEIFSLDRIGIHDDFFALGGDSLMATRLISRIQQVFSIALPMSSVFTAPTVYQLGLRVQALGTEHGGRLSFEWQEDLDPRRV